MFERLVATADVARRELHAPGDGPVRPRLGAPARPQPGAASWCACPPSGSTARGGTAPGSPRRWSAITGMAWMTGFADGPPVLVRGACDPLAGMHAVIATLLAVAPARRGRAGPDWSRRSWSRRRSTSPPSRWSSTRPAATLLERDGNRGPVAAPQGVYQATGEDRWLALAVADRRAVGGAGAASLGDPRAGHRRPGAHDRRGPAGRPRPDRRASWRPGSPTARRRRAGRAARRRRRAGRRRRRAARHDPQPPAPPPPAVRGRGPPGDRAPRGAGVPGAVRPRRRAGTARPRPTLGQHNDEVLAEIGPRPTRIAGAARARHHRRPGGGA